MWWWLLIGVLGFVIYVSYSLVFDTQCPYCSKRFGKRLISSELKSGIRLGRRFDTRTYKNNYICKGCGQDWWIDGEQSFNSLAYTILDYSDQKDPIQASTKMLANLIRTVSEHFRIELLIGAAFSIILPLIVVIWRIAQCNYEVGDNFSGVFILLVPTAIAGAFAGSIGGSIGRRLGRRWGIALAAIGGLVLGVIPAGMLLFPDC